MNLLANIKSAKKRIRVIEKKTAINRRRKSEIRTYIKKLNNAIENNNAEQAKELLKTVEKKLYRAVAKGTIHRNAASRKVSKLAKKVNMIA